MAQIALIIVDVPTMQTNDPYSYVIPTDLQNQIEVGMRVVVPFGRGSRLVLGMVVGLQEETDYDGKLKAVLSVMDLAPVLNPELLKLSDWLAETTYAFKISCMETMLPSVMRAKYEKTVRMTGDVPQDVQDRLFGDQEEIIYDPEKMPAQDVSELLRLRAAGQIEMDYHVKNQAKAKTQLTITPLMTPTELANERQNVKPNAKRQIDLLNYLGTIQGQTVSQHQVITETGISAAVISMGAQRGWLKKVALETYRDPTHEVTRTEPLALNDEQQVAVNRIDEAIQGRQAHNFLLEGVTGSGKTEVYLQTMAQALAIGRTALMLVPEISLTPQMVNRVKSRFGSKVAVLHSGLSTGEKYDEWRRIERHEAQVVVGARSAVFAPLDNLGIIIMDEEHETSYKQDEMPRYHAREVALWRGEYHQCPVVLGSATPSLETRARSQKGLYERLMLPHRIHQQLPTVQIVDMRDQLANGQETNFSDALKTAINERLDRHEQVVLMLNRRGFSSFVMCRDCGFVLKCPNCDISLTLHMDTHTMKCHYCGHEEGIPKICPNCGGHKIRYYGTGTEKVEQELREKLPEARVLRMDADTTRKKGAFERILTQFGNHEADILLGTQMIAKGLDFPDVTLVGVLNADTALGLPDFRASERTFELLTQVAGRAGRAEKPGEVLIQTFNPDNYAIQLAAQQDYERFYGVEMRIRHQGDYPPYFYTAQITASHEDEAVAAKAMYEITGELQRRLSPETIILGPTPKAIARVKRRYFYQVVVKYKHEAALKATLTDILQSTQSPERRGLKIAIDPDPYNFI
ncbi:primosomal protein N' [Levilactobacillus bambusae]|uniref:Replication restart protein PriA n=1 Tax=Levilactobacillus bambusae TaxID=2024736 RepID=A0A2V1N5K6_9LACO|nr:primosomal protein N' [Levilactobacillus bambusae]PWG00920.1 primosomal protein N' [Levilactobacillus bambusae]